MNIKDDASLALIPVAYKTSKLYSVIPNDDDGDFDFSRSSTGTRVNKGGFIETMPINTPRLDYPLLDGVVQGCPTMLTEPQRTNLLRYSEDLSVSYWTKSNVTTTANAAISPDGTQNASEIVGTTSSNFTRAINVAVGNGDTTMSCYVKSNDGVERDFVFGAGSLGASNNGTFTATSEWRRIEFTINTTAQSTDFGFFNSNGNQLNMYVWGVQLEAGSYPTSYIKTQGEVGGVTRSADDCVDAGTASDFNDSEGVFYVNAKIDDPSEADNNDFSLGDGDFNGNGVTISFKNLSASSQSIVGNCIIDGSGIPVAGTTITDASIKHDLFHKVAYQYKQADFKMFVNGFKIGASTYNDIFSSGDLQRVSFEGNGTGGTKFRGNTKEVMTFNTAMTDAQMEELTSYTSFKEMSEEMLFVVE